MTPLSAPHPAPITLCRVCKRSCWDSQQPTWAAGAQQGGMLSSVSKRDRDLTRCGHLPAVASPPPRPAPARGRGRRPPAREGGRKACPITSST